jgi:hypothetical protein
MHSAASRRSFVDSGIRLKKWPFDGRKKANRLVCVDQLKQFTE